jgi:hypothetical protein
MEFFFYIPPLFEIRSLILILIIGEDEDDVRESRFLGARYRR